MLPWWTTCPSLRHWSQGLIPVHVPPSPGIPRYWRATFWEPQFCKGPESVLRNLAVQGVLFTPTGLWNRQSASHLQPHLNPMPQHPNEFKLGKERNHEGCYFLSFSYISHCQYLPRLYTLEIIDGCERVTLICTVIDNNWIYMFGGTFMFSDNDLGPFC